MKYLLFFFLFIPSVLLPKERNLTLIVKGEHFSVYGYKDIDISSLIEKIKLNYFVDVKEIFKKDPKDLKTQLLESLDSLYQEVSDIFIQT